VQSAIKQVLSPARGQAAGPILPAAEARLRYAGAAIATLVTRELEERDDIRDMEIYEIGIVQSLAVASLVAMARREFNRQIVLLEMEETQNRTNLAAAFQQSAGYIEGFLSQLRRFSPAMEQNDFLVREHLTRNWIGQEEAKSRGAIVSELVYVEERWNVDWARLQKLRHELSRASLLHERVTVAGAPGGGAPAEHLSLRHFKAPHSGTPSERQCIAQ
jgi:hypothetical protein